LNFLKILGISSKKDVSVTSLAVAAQACRWREGGRGWPWDIPPRKTEEEDPFKISRTGIIVVRGWGELAEANWLW
jgi:hypothetical protein